MDDGQLSTLSCPDSPLYLAATMKVASQMKQMGKLNRSLRDKRAKLYIIRRCVVMLLRWSD
ncbi:hypothetical protein C2845_PM14G08900 [Panicum miliaceum]|uniref:Uncharacterized protein n=3 Tax=Panicum TaxID=4539 RepID=A0A3L6PL30_PANMI|nr:hypothetical protein C2845_PM14G08900 [Panicum miliaceum]